MPAPLMLPDISRVRQKGTGWRLDAVSDEIAGFFPRAKRIS